TRLRHRVHVPADTILRFAVGVEGAGTRDRSLAGVRFTVAVDGRQRFTRVVNPAATVHDRVWFDAEIDLAGDADRDVEIVLATDAAGRGALAGTPGWNDVRLISRRFRDRQRADTAHPNVIVLLIDTLRADRLGCYGATPSPSPTLDRLARDGMLFSQHVA